MALFLLKKLLKPPLSSSPSPLRFLASLSSAHLLSSPSSSPLACPPPLHVIPTHTTGENRSQPVPDIRKESIFCSLLYGSAGISYPCTSHSLEAGGNRDGDDNDGSMWADSVKRKRKVKMNKHKYKKRRKLLRRKT